jgi:hypothetical protein
MKKLLILVLFSALISLSETVSAQCPMCRGAVESAMKEEGNTKGKGLNKGILYLLATPYLAVALVGGAWWYNKKKK